MINFHDRAAGPQTGSQAGPQAGPQAGLHREPQRLKKAVLCIAFCAPFLLQTACSSKAVTNTAGGLGGALMASEIGLLEPYMLGAGLVAYAIYSPSAPNWTIQATPRPIRTPITQQHGERAPGSTQDAALPPVSVRPDTYEFELKMRALHTGGQGEFDRVLRESIDRIQVEINASGFEIIEKAERIDSTRPFATRAGRALVVFKF